MPEQRRAKIAALKITPGAEVTLMFKNTMEE